MANKSSSKSSEAHYSLYKTSKREESNRRRKLERELKKNPNNAAQLETAIKNIRHRRNKPQNPFWSSTRRKTAELFKRFCGRVNLEIYNNNEKVSSAALLLAGPYSKNRNYVTMSEVDMFKLSVRAKDKQGNYVWT